MIINARAVSVGLLHSLSGVMAISERPLLEAELMAIDEINQHGGVLGCRINPIIADGASIPVTFAQKAQEMLTAGIRMLFGCWPSSRWLKPQPASSGIPPDMKGLKNRSTLSTRGVASTSKSLQV